MREGGLGLLILNNQLPQPQRNKNLHGSTRLPTSTGEDDQQAFHYSEDYKLRVLPKSQRNLLKTFTKYCEQAYISLGTNPKTTILQSSG